AVTAYRDSSEDQNTGNVNIIEYRTKLEGDKISFYLEVVGKLFMDKVITNEDGDKSYGITYVHIFIDKDKDRATGYLIENLGADLMVEITGHSNTARNSQLMVFNTERAQDDWNGWETYYTVKTEVHENKLETQTTLIENSIADGVNVFYNILDSNGNYDSSDGVINSAEDGALIVTQTNLAPDILMDPVSEVLELELTARGADLIVNSIDISQTGAGVIQQIQAPLPITLLQDETRNFTIELDVTAAARGSLIKAWVAKPEDITLDQGTVTLNGCGSNSYVRAPPDDIIIDGAFGDWRPSTIIDVYSDEDPEAVKNKNVDLQEYSVHVDSSSFLVYSKVDGTIFSGTIVPHARTYQTEIPPSGKYFDNDLDGRIDKNGDGFEEDHGTWDNDFDNDYQLPDDPNNPVTPNTGPDDIDMDDDNDGIHDNEDDYLGSIYVGPGPKPQPPIVPVVAADDTQVFIDSDNDPATGYKLQGMLFGADYMIRVSGKYNVISKTSLYTFTSNQSNDWGGWVEKSTNINISAAIDGQRLELGFSKNILQLSEDFAVIVRTADWGGNKDYSGLISITDLYHRSVLSFDEPGTRGVTAGAVLNEIYPDDGANTGEWVEIYNANQNLSGWSLVQWTGTQWVTIYKFPTDPGLGYITINQTNNWSSPGKINVSMTIALRNDTGVIKDNVTIPSIDDTSSYARYKDYHGLPLDRAFDDDKDANDWYEELTGSTTKDLPNSTETPEFSNLV
ncbi:MAG: lamin tail domain-containing protein, partial [Thermoplasmata archaeon]|nr:lamin tail domain-containing protein [Thermoplasmata archaeon]